MKTKEVTYNYDAFDRRIGKHVDSDGNGTIDSSENYVYDGSDIVLVFDGSNNLTDRVLHGPLVDQVFAIEDSSSNNVLWALTDNQGTVRDIVDYDSGTDVTSVANHIKYDAFGNITSESDSSVEFLYSYTGRVYDEDSELYYNRARWYDPLIGRFISEDPIGFAAGDVNLSRYVTNSPTNFVDPSGLLEVATSSASFEGTGTAEPEPASIQSNGGGQQKGGGQNAKVDLELKKILQEVAPDKHKPSDPSVVISLPEYDLFGATVKPWVNFDPIVIIQNPPNIPIRVGVEVTPADFGSIPNDLFSDGKNPFANPRVFDTTIFFGGESHEDGSFSGFLFLKIKY